MEENNRLYDQFDTKKIDEFTSFNLDSFRDQIFIEESNEKISNDLIRTGILSNQLSSSGPMPGTCKTITLTTSTDGSYVELFRPSEGEVYQIMSAHMAKSGAGTTIHSNSYYDDAIFDDHEIDDYMACMTLKMTIFQQFRHALTRHDPKTYLA